MRYRLGKIILLGIALLFVFTLKADPVFAASLQFPTAGYYGWLWNEPVPWGSHEGVDIWSRKDGRGFSGPNGSRGNPVFLPRKGNIVDYVRDWQGRKIGFRVYHAGLARWTIYVHMADHATGTEYINPVIRLGWDREYEAGTLLGNQGNRLLAPAFGTPVTHLHFTVSETSSLSRHINPEPYLGFDVGYPRPPWWKEETPVSPYCYLIKGTDPAVYFVEKGFKRHIPNPPTFEGGLGFAWENICWISDAKVAGYPPLLPTPDVNYNWVVSHFVGRNLTLPNLPPLIIRSQTPHGAFRRDWGIESPDRDIPPDNFSSRYVTLFPFEKSGYYAFTFSTDDGLRVWIDGNLILDEWRDQVAEFRRRVFLSAGTHLLHLEHFEGFVNSFLEVKWRLFGEYAITQLPGDGTLEVKIFDALGGGIQLFLNGLGGVFQWLDSLWVVKDVEDLFFSPPLFVSWEQIDKDHSLHFALLIQGEDGVDRLLIYSANASNHWFEVGWVDMSPHLDPLFNQLERFTRNLERDYQDEFGIPPKVVKEIWVGHFVNDAWVGDHGGTVQNISFSRDVTPPVAEIDGPYLGKEGETLTFDASGSFDPEPGTGIAEVGWDLDQDGEYDDAVGFTASEAFGDDFEKTISIKVTDGAGNFSTDSTTVTIENVPPTIALDKSNVTSFFGGEAFVATLDDLIAFPLRITDPGSDDLTIFTNFGDTATQADTFFNDPNLGFDPFPSIDIHPQDVSISKLHQYGLPNLFELVVTATDDDGGVAEDSLLILITDNKTEIRTQGFWKNQYGEDLGGGVQYPQDFLFGFWEIVKFISKVYEEIASAGTLPEIEDILTRDGEGNPMIDRAQSQCLSTLLNFSSGSVKWNSSVDTDYDGTVDTTFSQAITQAEDLISDPESTDLELEQAKDICDSINNMEKIASGGFNFAYLFAFALPLLLVLGRIVLRFLV